MFKLSHFTLFALLVVIIWPLDTSAQLNGTIQDHGIYQFIQRLFRSSAHNARIVKDMTKTQPVVRLLGLAVGDEFPHLRDDMAAGARAGQSFLWRLVSAFAKVTNWRWDPENNEREMEDPYDGNFVD